MQQFQLHLEMKHLMQLPSQRSGNKLRPFYTSRRLVSFHPIRSFSIILNSTRIILIINKYDLLYMTLLLTHKSHILVRYDNYCHSFFLEFDSFYIPMRELLWRLLRPVVGKINPSKNPARDLKYF